MDPGTVLITGANGFIGRHLCRHLAAKGLRVRGSRRSGPEGMRQNVEFRISGEIHEGADWAPLLDGMAYVVHAAARVHVLKETEPDPHAAFRRVNVAGTETLARQAARAGVTRFVFMSSIGAQVGETKAPDRSQATPYQISKWEAERALRRVGEETGLPIVIVRPPLVYGARAPGAFRRLFAAVARGWPLPLASVRNRRSVLYVGNLCSAVETCLTHPDAPGRVMAVSDGPPISTPEFIRLIAQAIGRPARLFPCPVWFLRLAGKLLGRSLIVDRLTGDQVADDREIREILGWRPSASTRAALVETVAAQCGVATPALQAPTS